jgi:hypothetical protein
VAAKREAIALTRVERAEGYEADIRAECGKQGFIRRVTGGWPMMRRQGSQVCMQKPPGSA